MVTGVNLQTGTNFIGVIAATFGNVADVLDRQLQMKVLQVGESAKLRYLKGWATRIARGGLYGGATIFAALEFKNAWISFNRNNKTSKIFDGAFGISLIASTYLLRKGTTFMSAHLLG